MFCLVFSIFFPFRQNVLCVLSQQKNVYNWNLPEMKMLCRFVVAGRMPLRGWIISWFVLYFFVISKIPNTKRQHEVCKIFKYSNLDSITSLRFEPLECCELQDRGNHLGQFYWYDPKGKNWWNQISLVSGKKAGMNKLEED